MKSKQQLQSELDLKCMVDEQRKTNDQLYAIKLVEKIVFGFVGLALTAIALSLIYLVVVHR